MRHALANISLMFLVLSMLLVAYSTGTVLAQQRSDGLDQPLRTANICGAGSADETHFIVATTGDLLPNEHIQAVGEAQGYDTLFDHVRPFLQAADLAYTSFDGAMLESSERSGDPNFNYSPKLAAALKNAGISLVAAANNHTLDRGPEGISATLDVLEQNGIKQHDGRAVFGYPISAALTETGADGTPMTVQYFERARFELAPDMADTAPLLTQVRMGALGREYAALDAVRCATAATAPISDAPALIAPTTMDTLLPVAAQSAAQSDTPSWWIYPLLLLLLLLGVFAWWSYQRWAAQVALRDEQQRTARSRRAARQERLRTAAPPKSDEEVLRELLGLSDTGSQASETSEETQ